MSNGGSKVIRGSSIGSEERRGAALVLISRHERRLRGAARRFSLCADDAEDAYQRAFEILLRKAPTDDPEELLPWMLTVTKHEALAVRRNRERLLNGGARNGDADDSSALDGLASDLIGPTEHFERRERVTRSREALKALKPQEVRALTLRAQGYSYKEIGELTGWSHTKINRCMAEGRKRFFEIYASIEEGRRCEELAAALSAACDDERGVDKDAALGAHLSGCGACRAKMRAYRAIPQRVLELLPAAGFLGSTTAWGRTVERAHHVFDQAREATIGAIFRGSEAAATTAPATPRGGGSAVLAKALAVTAAASATAGGAIATDVPNRVIGGQAQIENFAPDLSDALGEAVGEVQQLEQSGELLPPPQPPAVSEFSADGGGTAVSGSTRSRQSGPVQSGGGREFGP